LGIEAEGLGHSGQDRRGVSLEEALVQGTGEKSVIQPIEDIRQRVVFGQDSLVQGRTGVAGGQDLHTGVVLLFESLDDGF